MVIVASLLMVPFATSFAGTSARLDVSPGSGRPGTTITVIGSGFTPRTAIRITWDGSMNGLPSTSVNGRGRFKISMGVPNGNEGHHEIAAAVGASKAVKTQAESAAVGEILASTGFDVVPAPVSTPVVTPDPTQVPTPKPTVVPTTAPTPTPPVA